MALAWIRQWELQHAKETLPAVWLLPMAPAWSSEHPASYPIPPVDDTLILAFWPPQLGDSISMKPCGLWSRILSIPITSLPV